MSTPSQPTDGDEAMRRLERAARARARGERLPGPEARSPACEVCGSPGVRWGALCGPCRDRLRDGLRYEPAAGVD